MQRSQSSLVISIHAPAKGATSVKGVIIRVVAIFQSTLPRRERRYCRCRCPCHFVFQSTLPRRERQCLYPLRCPVFQISIHAPAKGATGYVLRILHSSGISIHAPAKGATSQGFLSSVHPIQFQSTLPRRERPQPLPPKISAIINFNPRSREGSDIVSVLFSLGIRISIHAPAKGATLGHNKVYYISKRFQSTLPRRERPSNSRSRSAFTQSFQSTLPRRERHQQYANLSRLFNFNPRSREGSDDFDYACIAVRKQISIHAPAKGATWFIQPDA